MSRPTKKIKITDKIGMSSLGSPPNDFFDHVNMNLLHCPSKTCSTQMKPGIIAESTCSPLGVYAHHYIGIECSHCNSEWFLCMQCGSKQRTRIESIKQLKDHASNNHASQRKQEGCTNTVSDERYLSNIATASQHENDNPIELADDLPGGIDNDGFDNIIMDDIDSPDSSMNWLPVVDPTNLGFTERKNAAFFEQQHIGTTQGAGINYLVHRSSRRTALQAREYAMQVLPEGHAMLQMRIASMAFELTRGQNFRLAKVLAGAYKVGCEDGFACSSQRVTEKIELLTSQSTQATEGLEILKSILAEPFTHELIDRTAYANSTSIPKCWNDIRNWYLEGARSILSNLPIPPVLKDVEQHSYVSITECIRHFLAHRGLSEIALIPTNLDQQMNEQVDHACISERARNILSQTGQPLSSYIMFWSDDVEPNRIKSNRGSIWLLTATIATHRENAHSMGNTFPIAVGKKGSNHDPIISKVEKEMELLRTGAAPPFYIGPERKKVSIAFETFCTLQDQPERREFNSMRAGNGATTGRFGVSADHNALYSRNVLPACKTCLAKMEKALDEKKYQWPMDPCNACVRWDVLDDSHGIARWVAPKDYPETDRIVRQNDGTRLLRPTKITYETLKAAVDTAHDGYVNQGWSNQTCESYLEVEGLSTKYIDVVMDHCARSLSLKLAIAEPEKYAEILQDAKERAERYMKARYPSPWTRPTVTLELHPDVIMHLIFLGVVKTTIGQIQNCLSAQSKLNSFLKSTETYLKDFLTMSIDWIAIQPYQRGKMGGWVSENYLGFSRILPWFFQNIDSAVQMKTTFEAPENLPQNKWLLRHNKYWLQIRGLSTKGTSDELRARVATYMQSGAPEPLAAPEIPTASVEAVLVALMDLVQCLMSPIVTPTLINRTRYAVRVFLSKYDSLCRPLGQKTPPVLSSYNFICLLNLPDIMQRFGPLRGIYEGGPRGEGFVRFAKPHMTQGLRTNWHSQLMNKLHRSLGFLNVLPSDYEVPVSVQDNDALRARKGSFHLYKSVFELEQYFRRKRAVKERGPVSVIFAETESGVRMFSVVREYDYVLEIELKTMEPTHNFGFYYYSFGICRVKVLESNGSPLHKR